MDIDLASVWATAKGANPWLLLVAFMFNYLTFPLRGLRWRVMLKSYSESHDIPVPSPWFCAYAVLMAWTVNSIGWMRMGEAYRAYLYQRKYGKSFFGAFGTIIADRISDIIIIGTLLLIFVPLFIGKIGTHYAVLSMAGVVLILLAVATILWTIFKHGNRLPQWAPNWFTSLYANSISGIRVIKHRPVPVFTLGLLSWVCEGARIYFVILALGLDVDLLTVALLMVIYSLLSSFPTPGGIGFVEPGSTAAAVQFASLTLVGATAMVLVDRFITYVSIIIVGGIALACNTVLNLVNLRKPKEAPSTSLASTLADKPIE